MSRLGHWLRLLAVAAGYAAAFVAFQRFRPFSVASPWFVFVAVVYVRGLAFVGPTGDLKPAPHHARRQF